MSEDPEREAVQRAWTDEDGGPAFYSSMTDAMTEAASEALKPIRELHWKRRGRAIGFGDMPDEDFCNECSNIGQHVQWPCATAKLAYPDVTPSDNRGA